MARRVMTMGLLVGCFALGACKGDEAAKKDRSEKKDEKKAEPKEKKEKEALPDLNALASDASFGHHFDDFSNMTFGAVDHSPEEPPNFSPGWTGQEAYNVLKLAKDGELTNKTLNTGDGRVCLVFTDSGGTIRRAMLASRREKATEELAFADNGHVILWYRHDRDEDDPFEEWAYFHRGDDLALYQSRKDEGPRKHEKAPKDLKKHILAGVKRCIEKAGADNPLPGTAASPPAEAESGGTNAGGSNDGHGFGALAYSESAASWRLAHRKASAAEARKAALSGCKKDDCKVTESFGKGECRTVVHGPPPTVTWGKANDANASEADAMKQCSDKSGSEGACDVKGTWCNDG